MPKDNLDEPQDMDVDSSAAPALDEAKVDAAPAATETEAPADSSAATGETEADTLSVVRDVVEAREEEPAEAASPAEGEVEDGEVEPAKEQDSDDYSDVPFNSHPRFRKLLAERNTFKQDAQRYQNVEAFLDQNNLTSKEAADLMEIAGLAKTNPVAAWANPATKKWVQDLLVGAGEVLPQDLAQRVNNKELSLDVAQEMSRTRATLASQEAVRKFQEQRGQRQQRAAVGQSIQGAAEKWEAERSLRDPNFAAKVPLIRKKLEFLHATGQVPTTPEGVTEQLKLVYGAVNREVGQQQAAQTRKQTQPVVGQPPVKKAIRPITSGQVAATAQPAPKTTLEVIRQIRQRA